MGRIIGPLIALFLLGAFFALVEWRWPSRKQQRFRRGWLTDAVYFVFSPVVSRPFTAIVVGVSVLALAGVFGMGMTVEQLRHLDHRNTTIGRQPVFIQFLEFLFLADFISYWTHRLFHKFGPLWRFHAIHHSSTQLDWLASARVHPLNDALSHALSATPLLLLGFSAGAFAAYVPFLTLYAIMLHANVGWSFGRLRYVVASPAFHRWHHTSEEEGLDRNFSGLLPLWDIVFGTLYLPGNLQPEVFGTRNTVVPDGVLPQLLYPFRRTRREPLALAEPSTA
jgi:sterol desaturase/sphingolipid hydroxylase (fatty acid hydroxylase superfamily)